MTAQNKIEFSETGIMPDFHSIRERRPRNDLTDQRFGKLVVRQWTGESKWLCDCDCGRSTRVFTANLKRGNTSSCGCVRNIASSKRATKHGLYQTRAYKSWVSIRRRCFEVTNAAYKDYGAKGIGMDDEWAADPVAFIQDVGQPPTDDHTLDRIDNAKGYFPGNVRWATPLEQGSNKTNNRWVTYQGNKYTIAQLGRKIAEECGISHKQFQRSLEKAMYNPPRKVRK